MTQTANDAFSISKRARERGAERVWLGWAGGIDSSSLLTRITHDNPIKAKPEGVLFTLQLMLIDELVKGSQRAYMRDSVGAWVPNSERGIKVIISKEGLGKKGEKIVSE